jgi:fumarate reductase subunit D
VEEQLYWAFVSGAAMAVAVFFPVIALFVFGLGVPRPSVRERRRIVRQIEAAISESQALCSKKEGPSV